MPDLNSAKNLLEIAQQLDTIKLVLVVLLVLTGVGGTVLVLYLRSRAKTQERLDDRLKAQAQSEADIRRIREETDKHIREMKADVDRTLAEQQAKREQGQLGVLSQLAEQQQALLGIHQQTVLVLETISKRAGQMEGVIERYSQGIAERNRIQADANEIIRTGFAEAQRNTLDTRRQLIGHIENLAGDVSRSISAHQEERSAINFISQRLDEKHAELVKRVEDLPAVLTRELKPVIAQWSAANEKLGRISDTTLEAVAQLRDAEHKLIEAIDRALPPPTEVPRMEALPTTDRPALTPGAVQ